MTEHRPARPNVAAEVLAMCPRCEARPGLMCVTRSGAPAWVPHADRGRLGWAEWVRGFEAGAGDALDTFERVLTQQLERTEDSSGRGDLASSVQVALIRARRAFAPR